MVASRRPLADHDGRTWLGHPLAPHLRIELTDDDLAFFAPSGQTRIPWADIAALDVDIPVANWSAARLSRGVLAAMDTMVTATSTGVPLGNEMRFGNRCIEVVVTRRDGSQFRGSAQKHQPLGYPRPEVTAALAVMQGRLRPQP